MDNLSSIKQNFPLDKISCFGTGGLADFYVQVFSQEELLDVLTWASEKKIPVAVLGSGTNMFFDDAGFRGLLIHLKGKKIENIGKGQVRAWAGTSMKDLLDFAKMEGLGSLEAWTGLPGTVGGAIYGNAGCFGLETKDCLVSCEVWTKEEGVQVLPVKALFYEYRNSLFKKDTKKRWILSGTFQFSPKKIEDIERDAQEIASLRRHKQPPGKNNGSYFKNPPGFSAGALIDQLGLKGFEHQGVQVSPHHGNFMMNVRGSSQAILELEELIRMKVKEKYGLDLEREVIFLAEKGGTMV